MAFSLAPEFWSDTFGGSAPSSRWNADEERYEFDEDAVIYYVGPEPVLNATPVTYDEIPWPAIITTVVGTGVSDATFYTRTDIGDANNAYHSFGLATDTTAFTAEVDVSNGQDVADGTNGVTDLRIGVENVAPGSVFAISAAPQTIDQGFWIHEVGAAETSA